MRKSTKSAPAKASTRREITQPKNPCIRFIALTRGKIAIVDAEDYERLNKFKWTANRSGSDKFYAMRWERRGAKVHGFQMHREIMGAPKGSNLDHKNCNGLDNRKANLRYCTMRQNLYNQGVRKNNTSGFKGVTRRGEKFIASIGIAGKAVVLGTFPTPQEANAAYFGAATVIAGEFARSA